MAVVKAQKLLKVAKVRVKQMPVKTVTKMVNNFQVKNKTPAEIQITAEQLMN